MGPSSIHGASILSWRRAAMNVMVFQWPKGTLAVSLRPRGAHPRSGSMSVLVQVSSMKTRRSGAIRSCRSFHCVLRRATSGRSRSLATTLFFEAELLGVDEVPDRSVFDLETATGEFHDKTPQRK